MTKGARIYASVMASWVARLKRVRRSRRPIAWGTALRAMSAGIRSAMWCLARSRERGVGIRPRNPLPAEGGKDPEPVANMKLFAPKHFAVGLSGPSPPKTTSSWLQVIPNFRERRPSSGGWEAGTKRVLRSTLLIRKKRIRLCLTKQKAISIATAGWATILPLCPQPMCPLILEWKSRCCPIMHVATSKPLCWKFWATGSSKMAGLDFFHPDNLRFGQGIYLSRLVAAAKAVEGVETASVYRFQRLGLPNGDALKNGILPMGTWEIAQLDNDPSFPENGRLELKMGGGR